MDSNITCKGNNIFNHLKDNYFNIAFKFELCHKKKKCLKY